MMRREKAFWWRDRHNEIRACRARETGRWLASADVTGERDGTRLGLGPTGALNPAGEVVGQVPAGVPGMATANIRHQTADPVEPQRRVTGIGDHDSAPPPLSAAVVRLPETASVPRLHDMVDHVVQM